MATYRNDPARPDIPPRSEAPYDAPYGAPPSGPSSGGYPPPGPPVRPDNRPLLVAGVAALIALVAVVGYYLLVYVPERDARAETPPQPSVAVQTDRPPGALSDGDGFRPSVIEDEPLGGDPADSRPRRDPADDDLSGTPGLERPPRRAPLPDESQAEDEPRAENEPRATEPPAAQPATRPAARREVVDFVEEYFDRQSGGSLDAAMRLYAARVRYYDRGRVGAEAVEADKAAYVARFPERRYALAGPVRVVATGASDVTTVRADYTFAVGGGAAGDRSGRAYVELDLVPAGSTFVIQGERGDVY